MPPRPYDAPSSGLATGPVPQADLGGDLRQAGQFFLAISELHVWDYRWRVPCRQ